MIGSAADPANPPPFAFAGWLASARLSQTGLKRMDEANHPRNDMLGRARLEAEWRVLIEETPDDVRALLRDLIHDREVDLREHYNAYLSSDAEISTILGNADNRDAFTRIFLRGVGNLLDPRSDSSEIFYKQQEEIGALMARIGLPPYAVSRAMRKLTLWLLDYLSLFDLPKATLIGAIHFIISAVGLSLEIREISYQSGVTSHARIEEAYRLYALGQNLAMERERQRALLMEWGHRVLSAFHQNAGPGKLPRLWQSDFGLWLNHKARILFENAPKMDAIIQAVERIDEVLVPGLEVVNPDDRVVVADLIQLIERQIASIKFGLNGIFDLHMEIEKGRDPLTQLLNRRFMPSVLMREIYLQKTAHDQGFCILLVDIDHFKTINDTHGHKAGDLALQSVAQSVTSCVRPSDFVFRYGGEEIVVVLVDCNGTTARQTAERIRGDIASLRIALPDGSDLALTVSIGVADFAGEFDYEALVSRADQAMYVAKSRGRNQVVFA